MKIGEYVKTYTSGKPVPFKRVLDEVREYWEEFQKTNLSGMSEEAGDVLHFLQLWLYWRFKINGELWKNTKASTDKFMARRRVWEKIYKSVGLSKDVSHFCGNYHKLDKVISHLAEFGINETKAKAAFNKIVNK